MLSLQGAILVICASGSKPERIAETLYAPLRQSVYGREVLTKGICVDPFVKGDVFHNEMLPGTCALQVCWFGSGWNLNFGALLLGRTAL